MCPDQLPHTIVFSLDQITPPVQPPALLISGALVERLFTPILALCLFLSLFSSCRSIFPDMVARGGSNNQFWLIRPPKPLFALELSCFGRSQSDSTKNTLNLSILAPTMATDTRETRRSAQTMTAVPQTLR